MTEPTSYTFRQVKHSDGLVTSTLAAPSLMWFGAQISTGAFMVIVDEANAKSQEFMHSIVNQSVSSLSAATVALLRDVLAIAVVSTACAAVVVGINHALVVFVRPYRRFNAAITEAVAHAPRTVLAASAVGAGLCALGAVLDRPQGPLTSWFSLSYAVMYAPATVTAGLLYGRWLGQAGSATWFAADKLLLSKPQQPSKATDP